MAPLGRMGSRTPSQSPWRAFTRKCWANPNWLGLRTVFTGWASSGARKIATDAPVASAARVVSVLMSTAPQLLVRPGSEPPSPRPPADDAGAAAGAPAGGGGGAATGAHVGGVWSATPRVSATREVPCLQPTSAVSARTTTKSRLTPSTSPRASRRPRVPAPYETRNAPSPTGSSSVTSTVVMRAWRGPTRHHDTRRATASSSPSKHASTRPSGRFRTHPPTPASTATRRQVSRKKTPCTLPSTTTRRRTTIAGTVGRAGAEGGRGGGPVEPGAAATVRLRAVPPLLRGDPRPAHLPRVRLEDRTGHRVLSGQWLPGAVRPRAARRARPGVTVASGARPGRDPSGAG